MTQRSCAWMAGPDDAGVRIPVPKWWLVISRGVLVKGSRTQARVPRPAVTCRNTPKFASPLPPRSV